jgi:hypothetical protein
MGAVDGNNMPGGNGGDASVDTSGQQAILDNLTLTNGNNGNSGYSSSGGTGGTAAFTALDGLDAKTIETSGAVNLTVDALTVKKGYKLTASGTPHTLIISSYTFSLTGAAAGDTLLDVENITGLSASGSDVTLEGSPSGLSVGDTITLIDEGLDAVAWSESGVSIAGYTFTVTKRGAELTAEVTAIPSPSESSGCGAGLGSAGLLAAIFAALKSRRK